MNCKKADLDLGVFGEQQCFEVLFYWKEEFVNSTLILQKGLV